MIRAVEVLAFLAPLLALLAWRAAVVRGMDGPPPRLLAGLAVALVLLGALLAYLAEDEALPPGRYVPAQVLDGRVVPGRSE